MKGVTFRITVEYIKENTAVIEYFKKLGHNLFLVLHQKPNNYHYHGYLDIVTTTKTFRNKIKEMIDNTSEIPKGFKPFSVSDKIDDSDKYKAYCLYRAGHPIQNTYVHEDLDKLKEIHENACSKSNKNLLKQEGDLKLILKMVQPDSKIKDILYFICKFYKDNGRVVHKTKMQQLAHSIKLHQTEDYDWLVNDLINTDDGLLAIKQIEEVEEKGKVRKYYIYEDPE